MGNPSQRAMCVAAVWIAVACGGRTVDDFSENPSIRPSGGGPSDGYGGQTGGSPGSGGAWAGGATWAGGGTWAAGGTAGRGPSTITDAEVQQVCSLECLDFSTDCQTDFVTARDMLSLTNCIGLFDEFIRCILKLGVTCDPGQEPVFAPECLELGARLESCLEGWSNPTSRCVGFAGGSDPNATCGIDCSEDGGPAAECRDNIDTNKMCVCTAGRRAGSGFMPEECPSEEMVWYYCG
jgi:hypothetical protein